MTLEQLQLFVKAVEFGSRKRAAEELGLNQAAGSVAINAIESAYRIRLFERDGRGFRLTGIGQKFLSEAQAVLERASHAEQMLRDFAGYARPVTIAASQTISAHWLPARLATFHAAHPSVELNLLIRNSDEVQSALLRGEANIGLVEGPSHHPALVRQKIDNDQLVLVVASNQPPLPTTAGGAADLLAIRWVIREEGSGTRLALEELASQSGLAFDDLDIFLVLPSNEAVRGAIEAGAGATLISRHVVASSIAAGRLREIPAPLPAREFALIRPRDGYATSAERAVIAHLTGETAANFIDYVK